MDAGYDTLTRLLKGAFADEEGGATIVFGNVLRELCKQSEASFAWFDTPTARNQLKFLWGVLAVPAHERAAQTINNFRGCTLALTTEWRAGFRNAFPRNPDREEMQPAYVDRHAVFRPGLLDQAHSMEPEQIEAWRVPSQQRQADTPEAIHPSSQFQSQSSESSQESTQTGRKRHQTHLEELRKVRVYRGKYQYESNLHVASLVPWYRFTDIRVLSCEENVCLRPDTENTSHGTDPILLADLG
jgi:hypothetical protein